ncbi:MULTISPECIES: hypothetical protein [unclassified Colwellia]|uniref:hypothetical protein n=1 Tax=unclassified Colwellia TaxID=196834 RepID=UPI0015F37DC2|nr:MULTISPECIES: hypothetical protein [unclassified Colwellia]MBA6254511.1 hypothetical protein [Colwellia sp. MB3u-28]MBA6259208.1 hypothetical protein [Colwellia sp. MB3u-41]
MFKRIKNSLIFVLLICPDGVGIALVCVVMEVFYRISIYFGYSNSELEFLSLFFGLGTFIVLFIYRLTVYHLKKRKNGLGEKTL